MDKFEVSLLTGFVCLIFGLIMGMVILAAHTDGKNSMKTQMRAEAVAAGVACYLPTPDGDVKFVWKCQ